MLKKLIKLVVLDLNGTTLDNLISVGIPFMRHIFRTLNLTPPSDHQFRYEAAGDFMGFCRRYKAPHWFTHEHLIALREMWYLSRFSDLRFRSDTKRVLQRLKSLGFKLAVCSAEITPVVERLIDRDGLREYFESGLIYSEAWPKSDALWEMLDISGVPAEQAVYVDDTAHGIGEARSVGMQTIGFVNATAYNDTTRIHAAKPDATVHELSELEQILV